MGTLDPGQGGNEVAPNSMARSAARRFGRCHQIPGLRLQERQEPDLHRTGRVLVEPAGARSKFAGWETMSLQCRVNSVAPPVQNVPRLGSETEHRVSPEFTPTAEIRKTTHTGASISFRKPISPVGVASPRSLSIRGIQSYASSAAGWRSMRATPSCASRPPTRICSHRFCEDPHQKYV